MHSSLTSAFHLISILLLHHNLEVTARYLEVYCSSLQRTRRAIPKEVQAKIFRSLSLLVCNGFATRPLSSLAQAATQSNPGPMSPKSQSFHKENSSRYPGHLPESTSPLQGVEAVEPRQAVRLNEMEP